MAIASTSACNRLNYNLIAPSWQPTYHIDRYENTIRNYESEDLKIAPAPGGIVLIGSSSFTGWKTVEEDLAPLPIINRGFGGSTFPEVIHYLERTVLKYMPSSVVVYCENDMFMGPPKSPEQTRDEYVKLVEKVRQKLPKTKIYYVSMKPSPARWARWNDVKKANKLILDFVKSDRLQEYIDITQVMLSNGVPDSSIFKNDSLHMNEEGYKRWISVIKPALSNP